MHAEEPRARGHKQQNEVTLGTLAFESGHDICMRAHAA